MISKGDTIYSSVTGKTYTITKVFPDVRVAEVGFAEANGEEYFLKRHLNIKYPMEDSLLPPTLKEEKRKECESEFKKNSEAYEAIRNGCGEGSACVPILDYFREGAFYHTIYSKIDATSLTLSQISELPKNDKYNLLRTLVHGLMPLHSLGIIHGDLKPDNILVQKDGESWKIRMIDMDDCYREKQPKKPGLVLGTADYYSPELKAYNTYEVEDWDDSEEMAHVKRMGQDLTTKSDIFALGIIFCEFYGGERPRSTDERFNVVCEAAANGCMELPSTVTCDPKISALIWKMLEPDYKVRPSISQVGDDLRKIIIGQMEPPEIVFEALDVDGKLLNCTINTYSDGQIFYTLDGSEPTETSEKYTGPIQVKLYTTVSAIVTDGKKKSKVTVKQAWIMQNHTLSPQILVKEKSVTILPNERSSITTQIFYTLDGTLPTKSSTLYSGQFTAPDGVTKVRAVAIEPKAIPSPIVDANVYKLRVEKPIIHYKSGVVTIESTQGCDIHYTFDGSIPTKDSHKYTEPFELEDTTKFHVIAICEKDGSISETEEIKRPSGIVMSGKK